MTVARCSFLVLGEDSAAEAPATLVALARKVFRLVDHYYATARRLPKNLAQGERLL